MYVLDIIVNYCCWYVCIGHYCELLMCLCMYWILLCTVVVSMYVLDIIVNCHCVYVCIGHYCELLLLVCMYWTLL